jgi:hypothetical protein
VALPVRLVDHGAPDASDVADLSKEFMMSDIRWEIGQPEGAVLVWGEAQSACVTCVVFSFVVVREDRLSSFIFTSGVARRASDGSHGPEATSILLSGSQTELLPMII